MCAVEAKQKNNIHIGRSVYEALFPLELVGIASICIRTIVLTVLRSNASGGENLGREKAAESKTHFL